MGGRGSGGRRVGSGRKRQSELQRAIGGNAGKRGIVLQHPSSTAIAPVETFAVPLALFRRPGPDGTVVENTSAIAVWEELAPQAFEARTLTLATAAAFAMVCRAVASERTTDLSDADHRGLMARVGTWLKDFGLAPLGKPMYVAQVPVANPLDRFTKKAGA